MFKKKKTQAKCWLFLLTLLLYSKKKTFRESACPWFSQGWIQSVVLQLEAEAISSREGVTQRWAGTWDPLLQSLQRSYKGLKVTVCVCSWGKFWTKDKSPLLKSREPKED